MQRNRKQSSKCRQRRYKESAVTIIQTHLMLFYTLFEPISKQATDIVRLNFTFGEIIFFQHQGNRWKTRLQSESVVQRKWLHQAYAKVVLNECTKSVLIASYTKWRVIRWNKVVQQTSYKLKLKLRQNRYNSTHPFNIFSRFSVDAHGGMRSSVSFIHCSVKVFSSIELYSFFHRCISTQVKIICL